MESKNGKPEVSPAPAQPPVTAEKQEFPLDDATISVLADLDKQAIALAGQRQGVLFLFGRQHGLEGNWQLAPNGRELVKQPAPIGQAG